MNRRADRLCIINAKTNISALRAPVQTQVQHTDTDGRHFVVGCIDKGTTYGQYARYPGFSLTGKTVRLLGRPLATYRATCSLSRQSQPFLRLLSRSIFLSLSVCLFLSLSIFLSLFFVASIYCCNVSRVARNVCRLTRSFFLLSV